MGFKDFLATFRRKAAHQRLIAQNASQLARLAGQVRARARRAEGQPVLFFNASTRIEDLSLNAAFSLLAGSALELQGVPVVYLVCQRAMSRCVLGTNPNDPHASPPCRRCTSSSRWIYRGKRVEALTAQPQPGLQQELSALSLEELSAFTFNGLPLGELILPSLRWILRRHHLEDNPATRLLLRHSIASAASLAGQFNLLLERYSPRAVVVFNGMTYPEALLKHLARARGLPVFTHEVALQPYTAFFTSGEATAYPIRIPADFELTEAQNERLDAYLSERFQGNFTMAGVQFWPEMRSLDAAFLKKAERFKQIVPVFSNVIFDTSQAHANVLFETMFAWLDEVIALVKAYPDTLFVLRAHPDEERPGKEARESVAGWVAANGADRLPNLHFVPSTEYISSYELIQRSKFVMVYNSTIGLEASLMGAAVLCAGRARYTQIPTVIFPESLDAYRREARRLLTAGQITPPPEHRHNARRFLYYQLYRSSLPFDAFLETEGLRRGYVRLKRFDWRALLPENSPALRAIVNGILKDGDFLLEE